MKWFLNLKIATKMITGFMLVAVLTAAMAVFGIINIKSLDKSDTELYENMTVPIEHMAKISESFQRQRVNIRQAMLVNDPALMEAELTKISQRREEINEMSEEFEKRILSDEMRALFKTFTEAKETYRPLLDQAVALIRSGEKDKALELISETGAAGIASRAEQDAIDALIKAKSADAGNKAHANTAQANSVVLVTIIVTAAVLILSVVVGIIISRMISRPVKATAACAKAIASGDLDAPLSVKSKDEAGQLAATIDGEVRQAFKNIENARVVSEKQSRYQSAEVDKLLVNLQRLARGELLCDIVVAAADEDTSELSALFTEIAKNLCGGLDAIKGYISEISGVLGEMSNGNLNVGIESEYKGDFVELKRSINSIVESLNQVMGDINAAAEQVAAGTRQVSDGSQEISQGATEQSSSIEELTASVTQIAAQTKQNAVSAGDANNLSSMVRSSALQGNTQMKAMQQAMEEINESSESISKIIKVIDDIAFQTNILALNAAVEAARAGVHGKGFAVVAEEVRNLAARSANAAKETTELIEGSIKKTAAGTKIADDTAKALASIVDGVEKSGQLVSEIASASNEQATAISQVNKGIEQMSDVVQANSATAEEAAAAAEELSSQAEMLKNLVGQFQLKSSQKKSIASAEYHPDKGSDLNIDERHRRPVISLSESEFGKY